MNKLYSFDVYDTLITRKTATPKGIFALMQKCLLELDMYREIPEKLRKNFYCMRLEAERVARSALQGTENEDFTLSCIYKCLQDMELLTDEQTQCLLQLEYQVEKENSIPISENIEKVKKLTEEGKRVVLISDMYLEAEVIRDILSSLDNVFEKLPLYVSGNIGKTKSRGTLYHYVRQQENVQFTDWNHYGDNPYSDIKIPGQMGISTEQYKSVELFPWEASMLTESEQNAELQLLIGISKNARNVNRDSIAYNTGVSYAAPLLLPYVLWVLEQSKQKGIEKLYFIARDGYIVKKIADILIDAYMYPVSTSYLYGSRKAWRQPSVTKDNFDLQRLLDYSFGSWMYTYEALAGMLGLALDDLQEIFPFVDMKEKELSPSMWNSVIWILKNRQEQIADKIVNSQKGNRSAAISYLEQEIAGDDKKIAFVDLVGSGYSQKCLAELVSKFYEAPIETFFYRLDAFISDGRNKNYAFFPNKLMLGGIIEILCGAPHGQTSGYENKDGSWRPVLGQDEGQLLEGYGYEDYLSGIEDFIKKFCELYPDKPVLFNDLMVIESYFECLKDETNKALFEYIADMPYGITGDEKSVSSYIPKLTDKQLRQIYFTHKGENIKKYYKGYSLQLAHMRLSEKQKRELAFYEAHSEDKWIKWLRNYLIMNQSNSSPYELLASRIAIYGAGKKGQLLYRQLTQNSKHLRKYLHRGMEEMPQVVLWVDKNHKKCREAGLLVESPEKLLHTEFDQIIIAVAGKNMAEQIQKELTDMGIEKDRIVWINPSDNYC